MNWCSDDLKSNPFGKELLARGMNVETIKAWTKDPQVVVEGNEKSSLFDALEDLDYEQCLAATLEIYKLNQPAKMSANVKNVVIKEDIKLVGDKECCTLQ